MSIMSNAAVNNVNLVNSVRRQCSQSCQSRQCSPNRTAARRPWAEASRKFTIILIPNGDFGEITDTTSANGGRVCFAPSCPHLMGLMYTIGCQGFQRKNLSLAIQHQP